MATKRENGAGSVFQQKDGRWVAAVWDPIAAKKIRKYAPTENKARSALREMLKRLDSGEPAVDTSQTLAGYSKHWLATRAGRRRSGSTVNVYESRLRQHVLPVLGAKRMDKIRPVDIEELLDHIVKKNLTKGTVKAVRNALSALFSDAVKDRVIAVNPVRSAELPVMQTVTTKRYPTTQEVQQLLESAQRVSGDGARELGRILLMCAHTGARIGEILAAKWEDIDFDNNRWRVLRTITRDASGKRKVGLRTKTGETRTIQLSQSLVQELQLQCDYVTFVKASSRIWTDNDFVFPSATGEFKDQHNLAKQVKRIFPEWKHTFHALRHWFVSTSINAGISDVQIARIVGHRSTRTTNDVYGHLLDEGQDLIIRSVEDALGT